MIGHRQLLVALVQYFNSLPGISCILWASGLQRRNNLANISIPFRELAAFYVCVVVFDRALGFISIPFRELAAFYENLTP